MSDIIDGGPFLGISAITEVVSAAAQTEIIAGIDVVIAALAPQTAASQQSSPVPGFDKIDPYTAALLTTELTDLRTKVDAAPTA